MNLCLQPVKTMGYVMLPEYIKFAIRRDSKLTEPVARRLNTHWQRHHLLLAWQKIEQGLAA